MNNSVMKCCICNNERIGEFITINNKKYHLCCIEQLQQENKQLKEEVSLLDMRTDENIKLQNNWNELKKWLGTRINTDKDYKRNSHIKEKLQVEDYVIKQVMFFMQELEGNNE